MDFTVRVEGHREAMRALRRLGDGTDREMKQWLKEAAQPVASDVIARLARFRGVSLHTIKPAATARGVFVRQNARSVTGKRPDFGGLQMTEGLIPAAWSRVDETARLIEEAWARLADREGF